MKVIKVECKVDVLIEKLQKLYDEGKLEVQWQKVAPSTFIVTYRES